MVFVCCYRKEHFICSSHDEQNGLIICSTVSDFLNLRRAMPVAVQGGANETIERYGSAYHGRFSRYRTCSG